MHIQKSPVAGSMLIVLAKPASAWEGSLPHPCEMDIGWWHNGWVDVTLVGLLIVFSIALILLLRSLSVSIIKTMRTERSIIQTYDALVTRFVRGEVSREEFEKMKSECFE